ncbi:unnamed protein product [Somion occarium]|uniref:Uncharacterized protein n=1 Tax=Somion occarium TaxID=3059160 RepID=A0ABP1DHI3_9APHY
MFSNVQVDNEVLHGRESAKHFAMLFERERKGWSSVRTSFKETSSNTVVISWTGSTPSHSSIFRLMLGDIMA